MKLKNKIKIEKEEKKILKRFIHTILPTALEIEYEDLDISYCNEEMFMFAIDLLDGNNIDIKCSPWGDGTSILFDGKFEKALKEIIKLDIDKSSIDFCNMCLEVVNILRKYAK